MKTAKTPMHCTTVLTCSQCLLRIPGFLRPWISGMYGRKSSIIPLISDATSWTAENPAIWKPCRTRSLSYINK